MSSPEHLGERKEHIATRGTELQRHFNLWVAPLLWFLILFVIAFIVAISGPFCMICGLLLFLKGIHLMIIILFRDIYFQYDHVHYDDRSVTFSCEPNRYRWKKWIYPIKFQDIAQVRQKGERLLFIFNDTTRFELPERVRFSAESIVPLESPPTNESTSKGYLDMLFHIRRAVSVSLPYTMPFQEPLQEGSYPKKDVFASYVLVLARKENFDEISEKVRWEGIAKNKEGLGGPFSLIWILSLAFLKLWFWIVVLWGFAGVIYVMLNGSTAEAIAEFGVGDLSDNLLYGKIFVGLLTVFLVSYGLWSLDMRILDKRYGDEVNRKYWSGFEDHRTWRPGSRQELDNNLR